MDAKLIARLKEEFNPAVETEAILVARELGSPMATDDKIRD